MAALTYDEEHLPNDRTLLKDDLIKFYKRLRKELSQQSPPRKMKHFSAGEYGSPLKGERPHYHAILFGISQTEEDLIKRVWGKGIIQLDPCNEATAAYVAGYVYKKYNGEGYEHYSGDRIRPFQVSSNGIGKLHCLDNFQQFKSKGYLTNRGIKYALPLYYKKLLGEYTPVKEEYIAKIRKETAEYYEALGLDYFSKEAVKRRKESRLQIERNMLAEAKIRAERKALKKGRNADL